MQDTRTHKPYTTKSTAMTWRHAHDWGEGEAQGNAVLPQSGGEKGMEAGTKSKEKAEAVTWTAEGGTAGSRNHTWIAGRCLLRVSKILA